MNVHLRWACGGLLWNGAGPGPGGGGGNGGIGGTPVDKPVAALTIEGSRTLQRTRPGPAAAETPAATPDQI